ncbi:hypothetical protein PIB30_066360 [Stylosanthes scabra]|uniref:Uncharacterized protein n=1 Tax=Stylosanthes scabra TaxID=79078 RepID=A0ABU6XKP3_9FABA|nr:hypothetical protein [Stylosanthes scabra]
MNLSRLGPISETDALNSGGQNVCASRVDSLPRATFRGMNMCFYFRERAVHLVFRGRATHFDGGAKVKLFMLLIQAFLITGMISVNHTFLFAITNWLRKGEFPQTAPLYRMYLQGLGLPV